jgi:hypothetical protein
VVTRISDTPMPASRKNSSQPSWALKSRPDEVEAPAGEVEQHGGVAAEPDPRQREVHREQRAEDHAARVVEATVHVCGVHRGPRPVVTDRALHLIDGEVMCHDRLAL